MIPGRHYTAWESVIVVCLVGGLLQSVNARKRGQAPSLASNEFPGSGTPLAVC